MAKYNRKLLVPYLNDVMSAELLCEKLSRNIAFYKREIYNNQCAVNQRIIVPPVPEKKDFHEKRNAALTVIIMVIVVDALISWIQSLLSDFFLPITVLVFLISLLLVLVCFISIPDDKKDFDRAVAKYQNLSLAYENHQKNIPIYQAWIDYYQQRLSAEEALLQKATAQKQALYSINLIPQKYRTRQYAYYLYDFFSTGRSDDLEAVIQTMLLDKIVEQLNTIIAQNEDMLLNQRIAIALQEQSNDDQRDFHKKLLNKLDDVEENQERQQDYHRMIQENQNMSNLILMYDALNKS